jgi:hypothetical protein
MLLPHVPSFDTRHLAAEAATNALQEATLLTGRLLEHAHHLHLDDLTKLQAALGRAIAALQPHHDPEHDRDAREVRHAKPSLMRP